MDKPEKLPGVGDEAVGHMIRLQSVAEMRNVVVQKVSIEVVRGRDDWSPYGVPARMVPERPTRRLTIEWEESGD